MVSMVPQTLGNEVTSGLNALIHESDRMRDANAPEVRDLLRQIQKLQKVDARMAFVRFGDVAAICGDVDSVLEYYRKALLLPGEAETKGEFYGSLGNVGLYGRAHDLGSWLVDPKRGFFLRTWQKAVSIGQIQAVWGRLADAKRLYSELADVDFSLVERAVKVMQERGLNDKDVASVFDAMGAIQREHRIMFAGKHLVTSVKVVQPPEEPSYLYFSMPLNAAVDEIHAMNRKLARAVVEKLPAGAFPQGLVCSFAKAAPAELRAAA